MQMLILCIINQELCEIAKPTATVERVCELLAAAHLYDAAELKDYAFTFIKANAASVMKSGGWKELIKDKNLVNFVIGKLLVAAGKGHLVTIYFISDIWLIYLAGIFGY
jgi:hypothetical protein